MNPDFSQVESDAGQVTVNERFALFYPEKRPFFLEGIELFSTPNQLVYTRQIVNPIAGGKVTGKFGRTERRRTCRRKEKESAGARAVQHRAPAHATSAPTRTSASPTRTGRPSGEYNRVLAADSRIVFKKLYYVQGQVGRSWTGCSGSRSTAPAQVTSRRSGWPSSTAPGAPGASTTS